MPLAQHLFLFLLLFPCHPQAAFPTCTRSKIRKGAVSSSSKERRPSCCQLNAERFTTNSNSKNSTDGSSPPPSDTTTTATQLPSLWQQQAQALREEIEGMQVDLQRQKEARMVKARADVDRWISQTLVRCQVDEDTTLLNTVDETVAILRDNRYSPEQVYKMFCHLSEMTSSNKRSKISPTLELLVEAAGKMDCIDREDNPNKRWSGRIEADFRKRLFARDWGIELEDKDFSGRW